MSPEEFSLIALSGYTEYGRVSKKDYQFHMALPEKIIGCLDSEEFNPRILKNNVIMLFNVFESGTAKALLFGICPDDNLLKLVTLLVCVNRMVANEIDGEFHKRLEDVR